MTILGYRQWLVLSPKSAKRENQQDLAGRLLPPMGWPWPWSAGVTTSHCTQTRHRAAHLTDLGITVRTDPYEMAKLTRAKINEFRPILGCTCGLYGYRELINMPRSTRVGRSCDCKACAKSAEVAGLVLLAGQIVPHEKGFRAQYGRVLVLVHREPDRLAAVIHPDYGSIPIVASWKTAEPIRQRWTDPDDSKGGE